MNVLFVSWTTYANDDLSGMKPKDKTDTHHEILVTQRTKDSVELEIAQTGRYEGYDVSSFCVNQIYGYDLNMIINALASQSTLE